MSEENLPIKTVVVHVSASGDERDFSVNDIRKWHIDQGWADVGYHFVVRRSGDIERGREEGTIGSHVYGHNRHSLGVCWVGQVKMTPHQHLALVKLVACLCRKHGLTERNVRGHCEFPGVMKSCPNIEMNTFRREVALRLREIAAKTESCGIATCRCLEVPDVG